MKKELTKLFEKQSELTKQKLSELEERGLIIPQMQEGCKRPGPKNCQPGMVVGYVLLCESLKMKRINQEDARLLLAIECTGENAPMRHSHVSRLINVAFSQSKQDVISKITKLRREQWQRNQK